jgi:hypothetical protein
MSALLPRLPGQLCDPRGGWMFRVASDRPSAKQQAATRLIGRATAASAVGGEHAPGLCGLVAAVHQGERGQLRFRAVWLRMLRLRSRIPWDSSPTVTKVRHRTLPASRAAIVAGSRRRKLGDATSVSSTT